MQEGSGCRSKAASRLHYEREEAAVAFFSLVFVFNGFGTFFDFDDTEGGTCVGNVGSVRVHHGDKDGYIDQYVTPATTDD